jgi:hypothetical protein
LSGPPGERNGQYRHGERTKAAIAEQRKFSAFAQNAKNCLHYPSLWAIVAYGAVMHIRSV